MGGVGEGRREVEGRGGEKEGGGKRRNAMSALVTIAAKSGSTATTRNARRVCNAANRYLSTDRDRGEKGGGNKRERSLHGVTFVPTRVLSVILGLGQRIVFSFVCFFFWLSALYPAN